MIPLMLRVEVRLGFTAVPEANDAISVVVELVGAVPPTQLAPVDHVELEPLLAQVMVAPCTAHTEAARIERKLKVLPIFKTEPAIFQTGRRGKRFGILDVGYWMLE